RANRETSHAADSHPSQVADAGPRCQALAALALPRRDDPRAGVCPDAAATFPILPDTARRIHPHARRLATLDTRADCRRDWRGDGRAGADPYRPGRSEEHTSELSSREK